VTVGSTRIPPTLVADAFERPVRLPGRSTRRVPVTATLNGMPNATQRGRSITGPFTDHVVKTYRQRKRRVDRRKPNCCSEATHGMAENKSLD
jgi:hypothetical protein